jgi:hypothetical protein
MKNILGHTFSSLFLIVFLSSLVSTALFSQNEEALKRAFEGKRVEILIDMPASSEGIDLYADKERVLNFDEYSRRVKDFGIAISTGERVMITKIKKKKKHIEIQLAGGGYGIFGDENVSVKYERIEKSSREKELEKFVKDKTKSKPELDKLKDELNDLKRDRELEQDKINRRAEQAREMKQSRISEKRHHAGSRFNLRYDYNLGKEELSIENLKEVLR